MSTGYEGQTERHKHTFAVADVGDWDLDEDRSIVPSIQYALKADGIEAVVDGEEMNSAVFYVYCTENRATIEQALENQGISLDE
jgi:hypothetical protein